MDAGVSARYDAAAKRPQFKRLLDDVQAGAFNVVVVWQLDRFSRNTLVTLSSLTLLQKAGVDFLSHNERIDYTTPTGRLQLSILAAFAQYTSDNIGLQSTAGRLQRKRLGLHNGFLPFGLMKGEDGLAWPDTRPRDNGRSNYDGLLLLYQMAAEGRTDREIVMALNAGGWRVSGNRGPRPWAMTTVAQVIPNRFYLGELPDGAGGWLPGKHQPVIDVEVWERAQAQRRSRTASRGPHSSPAGVYSLTGLLECGYCGSKMWLYGPYRYCKHRARCSRRKDKGPCEQITVLLEVIEEQVLDWLRKLELPEEAIAAAEAAQVRREPEGGERERARLEAALMRLRELYQWGDISRQDYQAQTAELRGQLAALVSRQQVDARQVAESLRGVAEAWQQGTQAERHEIAVRCIQRVVVRDKVVVQIAPTPEVAALLTST